MSGDTRSTWMLFLAGVALVAVGAFLLMTALIHNHALFSSTSPEAASIYPEWSVSHICLFVGLGAGALLGGLVSAGCGLIAYSRRRN